MKKPKEPKDMEEPKMDTKPPRAVVPKLWEVELKDEQYSLILPKPILRDLQFECCNPSACPTKHRWKKQHFVLAQTQLGRGSVISSCHHQTQGTTETAPAASTGIWRTSLWGAAAPLTTFTLCALRTHQPCGSLYNIPASGAIQHAANMSTLEQLGMFCRPLGSPDAAVLMPMVTLQIKPNPEQHNVPATAQYRQAPSLGLHAACSGCGQQVPGISNAPGAPTGGSCQLPWLLFISKKVW